MKVSQFLIWLGVFLMVVDFILNLVNFVHLSTVHALGLNGSSLITILFSSFYQGGVLIGLGKILEAIQSKT